MTASRRAVLLGAILLAGLVHLLAVRDVMEPRVDQAYADFFIAHRAACPDPDRSAGRVGVLPWMLDFAAASQHRCATAFGSGWNTLESWGIWSDRPNVALSLDLAPGLAPRTLALHVAAYVPPGATRRLEITLDGRAADRLVLRDGPPVAVEIPLAAPMPRELRIGFHLDRTGSPARDGTSHDRRELGIALSDVALR